MYMWQTQIWGRAKRVRLGRCNKQFERLIKQDRKRQSRENKKNKTAMERRAAEKK
jgi:hypothetical protein